MISDLLVRAKSPSEACKVLSSMVGDEYSVIAKDNAKANYETLAMIVGESAHDFKARAKGLANDVKYRINVTDEETYRRILTGLLPMFNFARVKVLPWG